MSTRQSATVDAVLLRAATTARKQLAAGRGTDSTAPLLERFRGRLFDIEREARVRVQAGRLGSWELLPEFIAYLAAKGADLDVEVTTDALRMISWSSSPTLLTNAFANADRY